MRTQIALLLFLVAGASTSMADPAPVQEEVAFRAVTDRARAFEQNLGQFDDRVDFVLRGATYNAFVQSHSIVYTWSDRVDPDPADPQGRPTWTPAGAIRMTLDGANPEAQAVGLGEVRKQMGYHGSKYPGRYGLRPPQFERVAVRNAYTGVDLEYYLAKQQVEHDFLVSPGGDPSSIRLRFDGVDSLELSDTGDLILVAGEHRLVQQAPFAYQGPRENPTAVEVSYRLNDDGSVTYRLGDYDRTRQLVIDPIAWTTYIGGAGQDFLVDIAAGRFGEAVMLVFSSSPIFPVNEEGSLVLGRSGTESSVAHVRERFRKLRDDGEISSDDYETYVSKLEDVEDHAAAIALLDRCLESDGGGDDDDEEDFISLEPERVRMVRAATGPPAVIVVGAVETEANRLDQAAFILELTDEGAVVTSEMTHGSELNDQWLDVNVAPGCRDDRNLFFLTGTVGGEIDFGDEPANPFSDDSRVIQAAFTLDSSTSDLTPRYVDHTYLRGSVYRGISLSERLDICRFLMGLVTGIGDPPPSIHLSTYDWKAGSFLTQNRLFDLPEPGRIGEIKQAGDNIFVAQQATEGLRYLHYQLDESDLVTNTSLLSFGGEGLLHQGLLTNPSRPREVTAFYRMNNCEEVSNLPPSPFGAYGFPTQDRCTVARALNFGAEPPATTASYYVGPGGGFRFSQRMGGGFAAGGVAMVEVYSIDDDTPAPLSGFVQGSDAYAFSGQLNDRAYLTPVTPARFQWRPLARGMIGTLFGTGLADEPLVADSLPLPSLVDLELHDAGGSVWDLGQFYAGPNQINFLVPDAALVGPAMLRLLRPDGTVLYGETWLNQVSPEIFTNNGVATANLIRIAESGERTDTTTLAGPIEIRRGDRLIVNFFATGIEGSDYQATYSGGVAKFIAVAPSPQYVGLWQVAFEMDPGRLEMSGLQRVRFNVAVDGEATGPVFIEVDLKD